MGKCRITEIPREIYEACQEPVDVDCIVSEIEKITDFSDYYDMRCGYELIGYTNKNLLVVILDELYRSREKMDRLPDGCTSRIVRTFINCGFNMNACRGLVGATCLQVMSYCFCKDVAEATELLLDAGAVPTPVKVGDDRTVELWNIMRSMELYDCSEEVCDSFLKASDLIKKITDNRIDIPPYSCYSCKYLEEEQELKIWGHPCNFNRGGQKIDNCHGFVKKVKAD